MHVGPATNLATNSSPAPCAGGGMSSAPTPARGNSEGQLGKGQQIKMLLQISLCICACTCVCLQSSTMYVIHYSKDVYIPQVHLSVLVFIEALETEKKYQCLEIII